MAYIIPMSLIENCDDHVVYEYYDEIWERDHTKQPLSKERIRTVGRRVGRVMLDKRTRQFTQLAGHDWDENGRWAALLRSNGGSEWRNQKKVSRSTTKAAESVSNFPAFASYSAAPGLLSRSSYCRR